MPYSPIFQSIIDQLDHIMTQFHHSKQDLGYGYRRRFENGMRFDMINYHKKSTYILRVSRGARLVKQNPWLGSRFDEISKVIAKCEIQNIEMLKYKNVSSVLQLLHDAPSSIGAFD